jgi:serine/threonine protein phosphatase PrpC
LFGSTERFDLANIIEKLFGGKKAEAPKSGEIPTVPIPGEHPRPSQPPIFDKMHLELFQLIVGSAQSVGKQREHNEDALLTFNTLFASDGKSMPFGLFIVADGMGGHQQGEIASGIAIRSIASQLIHKVYMALLSLPPSPPDESIQEILETVVQDTHRTIAQDAPGSGTTLTVLLVLDKQMTIAHIGDSRAYSISPEGEIQVLTRDHSLVMRMMELGQLTEEEAAIHPQRNVLYRALGQGEPFTPDISTSPLPESGHLLLCSDGLWGVVPEEEIIKLVNSAPGPQIACQLLIDAANTAGGPDNITAILVRLPE